MCERVEIAPGGAGENFLLHFDGPLDVTWRHVEFFWGHRIAWPMLAAAAARFWKSPRQSIPVPAQARR